MKIVSNLLLSRSQFKLMPFFLHTFHHGFFDEEEQKLNYPNYCKAKIEPISNLVDANYYFNDYMTVFTTTWLILT